MVDQLQRHLALEGSDNEPTPPLLCPRCGYAHNPGEEPKPLAQGMVRLSNIEIERTYGALVGMSQLALADDKAERKVAVLLRKYFDQPYQILEQQKKSMFIRISPVGSMEITPRMSEMRQIELSGILNDTQDIPVVPTDLYIKTSDFARTEKGGARDPRLAQIKFQLGFLYSLDE